MTHTKNRIRRAGFALIITISMMILLSLLCVGLLSLSSASLRTSSQAKARSEARSNARLALMMALNDLQVNAGPDTRITAPADILGDTVPQPRITGVWNSRKLDPESPDTSSDLTDEAKSSDFRKWLVSIPDPMAGREQDYATQATPSGDTARIILSKRYSRDKTTDLVVDSVPVQSSSSSRNQVNGRLAYAVFDEGIKARVNMGVRSPGSALATRAEQLGSGQRPRIDRIEDITSVADEAVDLSTNEGMSLVSKMVTLKNAELGHGAANSSFEKHFSDLTPYSLGLMTDVSNGGFRKDLNLLANSASSPPDPYRSGSGIYETTYDLNLPSDPKWSQLLEFANLFNDRNSSRSAYLTTGTGDTPTLSASAPGNWSASNEVKGGVAVPNPELPDSPVLLPSIAKVQMVYSLHVHDIFRFPKAGPTPLAQHFHNGPYNAEWKAKNLWDNNWSAKNKDREVNYQMWVFCTPIITLHNPYNVAMEIDSGDLTIDFVNVPFAMKFFVNGMPQTKELIPYTEMFYWNDKGNERRYTMTLYNKSVSGSTVSVDQRTPIRLLPGEVKVFSPYMNPNTNYFDTGSEWYNVFNRNTINIRAIPGWLGEGIGYGQDQPLPSKYNPLRLANDGQGRITGNGRMMQDGMALTGDEQIHVEFAPIPDPDEEEKRFTIEMTLDGANRRGSARSVVLDFDYEMTNGLQSEILGKDGTLRWPADDSIQAAELRDQWQTPLAGFQNIRPFALLSAYAKTTYGGVDASNDDGRYPAKPWISTIMRAR